MWSEQDGGGVEMREIHGRIKRCQAVWAVEIALLTIHVFTRSP